MKAAEALQAIRQRVKVSRDQRVEIRAVPFQPGSEVEVIVVGPARGTKEEAEETPIYAYAERLKRQKGIPRYTVEEIERIIHQSRGLSG
ncbi:MAG: hypothetical protein ACRERD_24115 [Candidatus Binatia bacterium]